MNKWNWLGQADRLNHLWKSMALFAAVNLLLMQILRLYSHVLYSDFLADPHQPLDVLRAYFMGFRFDLSTISYLFTPAALVGYLAVFWDRPSLVTGIRRYLLTVCFLMFIVLVCDVGYYSYFQDHLNVMIFGLIEDDTTALLKTFWKNYPLVKFALALLTLGLLLRFAINRFFNLSMAGAAHPLPTWKRVLVLGLPLPLLALGARGTLALFPLSVQDTVVTSNPSLNHLAYNGFHAFYRAFRLRSQQTAKWNQHLLFFGYENPAQAFADYFDVPVEQAQNNPLDLLRHQTAKNEWAARTRPHVILIVMESFGSAYIPYQSDSFNIMGELAAHFQKDNWTPSFLPSHSSTIGSLSSLMVGLPQQPQAGFLTETDSLQVHFSSSAADVYNRAGYQTRFVYGGNPGWRDINKFAITQGFSAVEGDVDVEKNLGGLKERHDWGIYDEDLFQHVEKNLEQSTRPQMMLVMTTTNHPPYQVPSTFKASDLKAPPELESRLLADRNLVAQRFRAYQYSNQTLGAWLSRLQKSPLGKNTIVAVTGDHSFWMVNFSEKELLQKWGVPFFLMTPPELKRKSLQNVYGSHLDIWPTLYNLSLSEASYFSLGRDLLAGGSDNYAYHSSLLALSPEGGILAGRGPNQYTPLQWAKDHRLEPAQSSPALDRLAKKYKALMSLTDSYILSEKKKR